MKSYYSSTSPCGESGSNPFKTGAGPGNCTIQIEDFPSCEQTCDPCQQKALSLGTSDGGISDGISIGLSLPDTEEVLESMPVDPSDAPWLDIEQYAKDIAQPCASIDDCEFLSRRTLAAFLNANKDYKERLESGKDNTEDQQAVAHEVAKLKKEVLAMNEVERAACPFLPFTEQLLAASEGLNRSLGSVLDEESNIQFCDDQYTMGDETYTPQPFVPQEKAVEDVCLQRTGPFRGNTEEVFKREMNKADAERRSLSFFRTFLSDFSASELRNEVGWLDNNFKSVFQQLHPGRDYEQAKITWVEELTHRAPGLSEQEKRRIAELILYIEDAKELRQICVSDNTGKLLPKEYEYLKPSHHIPLVTDLHSDEATQSLVQLSELTDDYGNTLCELGIACWRNKTGQTKDNPKACEALEQLSYRIAEQIILRHPTMAIPGMNKVGTIALLSSAIADLYSDERFEVGEVSLYGKCDSRPLLSLHAKGIVLHVPGDEKNPVGTAQSVHLYFDQYKHDKIDWMALQIAVPGKAEGKVIYPSHEHGNKRYQYVETEVYRSVPAPPFNSSWALAPYEKYSPLQDPDLGVGGNVLPVSRIKETDEKDPIEGGNRRFLQLVFGSEGDLINMVSPIGTKDYLSNARIAEFGDAVHSDYEMQLANYHMGDGISFGCLKEENPNEKTPAMLKEDVIKRCVKRLPKVFNDYDFSRALEGAKTTMTSKGVNNYCQRFLNLKVPNQAAYEACSLQVAEQVRQTAPTSKTALCDYYTTYNTADVLMAQAYASKSPILRKLLTGASIGVNFCRIAIPAALSYGGARVLLSQVRLIATGQVYYNAEIQAKAIDFLKLAHTVGRAGAALGVGKSNVQMFNDMLENKWHDLSGSISRALVANAFGTIVGFSLFKAQLCQDRVIFHVNGNQIKAWSIKGDVGKGKIVIMPQRGEMTQTQFNTLVAGLRQQGVKVYTMGKHGGTPGLGGGRTPHQAIPTTFMPRIAGVPANHPSAAGLPLTAHAPGERFSLTPHQRVGNPLEDTERRFHELEEMLTAFRADLPDPATPSRGTPQPFITRPQPSTRPSTQPTTQPATGPVAVLEEPKVLDPITIQQHQEIADVVRQWQEQTGPQAGGDGASTPHPGRPVELDYDCRPQFFPWMLNMGEEPGDGNTGGDPSDGNADDGNNRDGGVNGPGDGKGPGTPGRGETVAQGDEDLPEAIQEYHRSLNAIEIAVKRDVNDYLHNELSQIVAAQERALSGEDPENFEEQMMAFTIQQVSEKIQDVILTYEEDLDAIETTIAAAQEKLSFAPSLDVFWDGADKNKKIYLLTQDGRAFMVETDLFWIPHVFSPVEEHIRENVGFMLAGDEHGERAINELVMNMVLGNHLSGVSYSAANGLEIDESKQLDIYLSLSRRLRAIPGRLVFLEEEDVETIQAHVDNADEYSGPIPLRVPARSINMNRMPVFVYSGTDEEIIDQGDGFVESVLTTASGKLKIHISEEVTERYPFCDPFAAQFREKLKRLLKQHYLVKRAVKENKGIDKTKEDFENTRKQLEDELMQNMDQFHTVVRTTSQGILAISQGGDNFLLPYSYDPSWDPFGHHILLGQKALLQHVVSELNSIESRPLDEEDIEAQKMLEEMRPEPAVNEKLQQHKTREPAEQTIIATGERDQNADPLYALRIYDINRYAEVTATQIIIVPPRSEVSSSFEVFHDSEPIEIVEVLKCPDGQRPSSRPGSPDDQDLQGPADPNRPSPDDNSDNRNLRELDRMVATDTRGVGWGGPRLVAERGNGERSAMTSLSRSGRFSGGRGATQNRGTLRGKEQGQVSVINHRLAVYPVPASSEISITGMETFSHPTLYLLNNVGQHALVVTETQLRQQHFQVDVSSLVPGVYQLIAEDDLGHRAWTRVVKH